MRIRSAATLPIVAAFGLLYATAASAGAWGDLKDVSKPQFITVKDNGGGHGGGNGGGNGNGSGGGNDGGNGGGKADSNGSGNGGGTASSTGSGVDSSGDEALGNSGKTRGIRPGKADTISLDDDTTAALAGSGLSPTVGNGPFRNHGARVSAMVSLAKELGYSANVGAMQANFGTPQETGIRDLQERIADLKADPTTDPALIDALEAELADRIQQVKPGTGPTGDWETTNLDVDGNGLVDDRDLTLAREGFRPFD
ncbi:hypothetical protein [Inquilinus sp. OTU3971]|uniref:hypothetical protein n=1 Tax=Inquilinus sp. OTU3971 TaxID=3043855 RepID=UPI00313C2556